MRKYTIMMLKENDFSRLEINLPNCLENYRYFRNRLETDTKLLVLVKANAYGHGAVEFAGMMEDAGADYPWSDNELSGSIPMSFEHVLERAADADVWVFKYNRPQNMTYADLEDEYGGYVRFAPFRNRKVYACNTHTTPYYEDIPIHPDYVLADMVWVLHPELMPEYTPRYFHKMQE